MLRTIRPTRPSAVTLPTQIAMNQRTCFMDELVIATRLVNFSPENRMRCLRPIEIFRVHMLTGIWLSRAGGRQGVPGELICEDVAAA